jgi:hypothetical protein
MCQQAILKCLGYSRTGKQDRTLRGETLQDYRKLRKRVWIQPHPFSFVCDYRKINPIIGPIMINFSMSHIWQLVICFILIHAIIFALMYVYLGQVAAIAKKKLQEKESSREQ